MKWRMVWSRRAERDFHALEPAAARRIQHALDRFSDTGQADIARIVNVTPERYRIRVGSHRIIVRLFEDQAEARILRIRHRGSAY